MKYFKLIFIAIIFLIGVTVIILGGLYIYRKTERKVLTQNDRKRQTGNFIRLNAGITHYELSGPDTGQVVVLLHDFGLPYYSWDSTYNHLIQHGYHVLRYDQYGCGYSDRPDVIYNKDLYINQLRNLIKALNLKSPFIIAGVSFGAILATDFTVQYPAMVGKLILIDPDYENLMPDKPSLVVRYYESIHPREHTERQLLSFKHPGNYPYWSRKYEEQMQYEGFTNAQVSTMYNYDYNAPESNKRLNALHKPILLIWGRDDATVPFNYSDSIRNILKTEFFPVDDAGHLSYIEQAALVNSRIVDFLREK